jgi:hypothetical protein
MKWKKRIDFSMLAAWLILSLTMAAIAFFWFGKDFRGYYAATQVLMAGGNPYDYDLVVQVLLQVTGRMGNNPYYYPPWFLWIFTPIASLPFQVARAVWMVFNLAIWNLGLWQLGEVIGWPRKGWGQYVLFCVVTCAFAWITWKYEQAGILIFMMIVLLILSIRKQKTIWSGIWMALLLIKPNITLLVVAGISLWLLRKGQWRTVLVMLVTLTVLLLISTWITPDWFKPFSEDGFGQGLTAVLDGPGRVVALRVNTTLLDWLTTLGVEHRYHILIYGMCIFVGFLVSLWTVYNSESFLELVSILLLISFALTPYALQYDYSPLAVVLCWALSLCVSSPKALGVAVLLTGFVLSVIFWEQNIATGFWMVIGLIALTIWARYQKTMHMLPESDPSHP